jgi:ubiquinone/menaquinone biosynthesis C-methylase UbiE
MTADDKRIEGVVACPGDYWRAPTVAQEYETRRFDSLWGRLYRWREESAIQRALRGLRPANTVLDTACGTGRVTRLLRRNGFQVTGCDVSIAMITVARNRLTTLGYDVPLVATDARALPYAEKSFDAATCIGLLMHLYADARVAVLRQLARVSRDRIVVQYGYVDALNRARARITGRPPGNVQYPVSERELRMDLRSSGLTERARFWVFRGLSSSLLLVLTN